MKEQVAVTLEACYQPWNRWFENRIYPSPDGVAIFFTEVTERRRAEEEAEKVRRRLVEAQRVAHVGSWEWDVGGNAVTWSDELYRIYGVELGAALGGYEGFLSRVHPDDLAKTQEHDRGRRRARHALRLRSSDRAHRRDRCACCTRAARPSSSRASWRGWSAAAGT